MKLRSFSGLILAFLFYAFVPSAMGQEADREAALRAFEARDFSAAIELFKKVTRKNSADAESWLHLGSSYLQRNKPKDAMNALDKAVELDPQNDRYLAVLAFARFAAGNRLAGIMARRSLEINPQNGTAYLVLGMIDLRYGSSSSAYENAKRGIEFEPKVAQLYRLKSQALMSNYSVLTESLASPPETRYTLLSEAAADLAKFIDLTDDPGIRQDYREQLGALKYFAEYYRNRENPKSSVGPVSPPDANRTRLKLLSKPHPAYTDYARMYGIEGTVKVLITFGADGKIGPVLIIQSLERGLDLEAVKAARKIRFDPPTENGVPVAFVRTIEFAFSLY